MALNSIIGSEYLTSKDKNIETFRGIAIILVVLTHVIGGFDISKNNFGNFLWYSLEYIRMPLFTVISGYVYSLKPVNRQNIDFFFKGKVRRLAAPFFIVSIILFFAKYFMPTNSTPSLESITTIFTYPMVGMWFLQAILWVFIVVAILEYFSVLNKFKNLIFTIIIVTLPNFFFDFTYFLSLKGFIYLLPFFLLGIGLKRFDFILRQNRQVFSFALTLLFFSVAIFQLNYFEVIDFETSRTGVIAYITGFSAMIVIFKFTFTNDLLCKLGAYSYSIYLFHSLGSGLSRFALRNMYVEDFTILVLFGTGVGLILPIIVENISNNYLLTRFLLLGKKLKEH